MDIVFRQPIPGDVSWIASRLREADRRELIASTGEDPAVALAASMALGSCLVAECDREPVAVLGLPVISLLPKTGIPWMVGTDWLDEHPAVFGRYSSVIIDNWMSRVDRMSNYVDSRNVKAIDWLSWLGFDIEEAEPHGPYGVPFHKFTWERRRYV